MTDLRENIAQIVYEADWFGRHDPQLEVSKGQKPAWMPGGNSLRQDEARETADSILSLLREEGETRASGFSAAKEAAVKVAEEEIAACEDERNLRPLNSYHWAFWDRARRTANDISTAIQQIEDRP